MAFNPIQAQSFSLSGSGSAIGDVVLNLKSFKDINGTNIALSDLGAKGYMTIEPGNGTQEEQISFSGVTQNADGSAQLTGVKTVLFKSPYTETSGIAKTHAGSVVAVLSNTSGFYNQFAILANDETITGNWLAPDPVSTQSVATKNYVVNTIASGGTLKTDGLVMAATAGETVSTGKVVYLKASDGRWYLATDSTQSTLYGVQLGIAQGAGTAGNPITGGVLVEGYDTNQSGLTTGVTYYISTGGALATSTGTNARKIGQGGQTSTKIYFNPNYTAATTSQANAVVQANSSGKIDTTFLSANTTTTIHVFTSTGTWTKPTGLTYAIIEGVGGGAAGGGAAGSSGSAGAGGGAAAYSRRLVVASGLGTTETVTIGTGGAGASNAAGASGLPTTFGSWITAGGGLGGGAGLLSDGGIGGTASGGDVNIPGGDGAPPGAAINASSGSGGASYFGSGAGGLHGASNVTGRNASVVGSGGGGSTSGGSTSQGGSGGSGIVIVTEFYT